MLQDVFLACVGGPFPILNAQYKKDGTPDMRYSANKAFYGNSYTSPSSSHYATTDIRYQTGYIRDNGTFIQPFYKTNPGKGSSKSKEIT